MGWATVGGVGIVAGGAGAGSVTGAGVGTAGAAAEGASGVVAGIGAGADCGPLAVRAGVATGATACSAPDAGAGGAVGVELPRCRYHQPAAASSTSATNPATKPALREEGPAAVGKGMRNATGEATTRGGGGGGGGDGGGGGGGGGGSGRGDAGGGAINGAAAAVASMPVPQLAQKRACGLLAAPQLRQLRLGAVAAAGATGSSLNPQALQNRAPSRFSATHCGHRIDIGSLFRVAYPAKASSGPCLGALAVPGVGRTTLAPTLGRLGSARKARSGASLGPAVGGIAEVVVRHRVGRVVNDDPRSRWLHHDAAAL